MNVVAERMLQKGVVVDDDGQEHRLHSHTSREQCEFLQQLVVETEARTTLEIGLAYGMSALSICEMLSKQGGLTHHVIDPQQDLWKNIGLKHLREAGFERLVDFRRDYSHNVLPELYRSGVKIDFAYIDTTKVFDVVAVDAYYTVLMLRIGGVVAFDDCSFPGIRKLVRLLTQHPGLRVYRSFGRARDKKSIRVLSRLAKLIPYNERLFAPSLLVTEAQLGVDAHCVAFQKVSDTTKKWNSFEDF